MRILFFVIGIIFGALISIGTVELYFNENYEHKYVSRSDGSINTRLSYETYVGDPSLREKSFIYRYIFYYKNLMK